MSDKLRIIGKKAYCSEKCHFATLRMWKYAKDNGVVTDCYFEYEKLDNI